MSIHGKLSDMFFVRCVNVRIRIGVGEGQIIQCMHSCVFVSLPNAETAIRGLLEQKATEVRKHNKELTTEILRNFELLLQRLAHYNYIPRCTR